MSGSPASEGLPLHLTSWGLSTGSPASWEVLQCSSWTFRESSSHLHPWSCLPVCWASWQISRVIIVPCLLFTQLSCSTYNCQFILDLFIPLRIVGPGFPAPWPCHQAICPSPWTVLLLGAWLFFLHFASFFSLAVSLLFAFLGFCGRLPADSVFASLHLKWFWVSVVGVFHPDLPTHP